MSPDSGRVTSRFPMKERLCLLTICQTLPIIDFRRRLPLSKLRGLNRPELYRGTHPEPSSTVTILWSPHSNCNDTQVLYLVSRERSTLEGVQDLEVTVYFSPVIDRPRVSVSIVRGLCDDWIKIKSTSFITDEQIHSHCVQEKTRQTWLPFEFIAFLCGVLNLTFILVGCTFRCLVRHVCERCGPVTHKTVWNHDRRLSSNDCPYHYLSNPHFETHYSFP